MNDTRKALELAREALQRGSIIKGAMVIAAIDAALSAPADPAAPSGRVLVPAEPTPEMAKAGCYRYCNAFVRDYKAMIAAAPVALTPAQQYADELVVALRGVMNLHTYKIHTASAWDGLLKRARAVLAAIEATGQEGAAPTPVAQPCTYKCEAWPECGCSPAAPATECRDEMLRYAMGAMAQSGIELTDEMLRYAMGAMGVGSPKEAARFRLFWRFATERLSPTPAAPVVQPLTDEQIAGLHTVFRSGHHPSRDFVAGIRAAERAHGITKASRG